VAALQLLVTGQDFGTQMQEFQRQVEQHADKKGHLELALQS
jgi:hypothetical protein